MCYLITEEVKAKHPRVTYADLYQVIVSYSNYKLNLFQTCWIFVTATCLVTLLDLWYLDKTVINRNSRN